MNRHLNDPEARAEWSERFGEPEQQQGFHETFMRPQPCAAPVVGPYQPLFNYLHDELGVLALQTNMQEIIQICLEINAEASGPDAEDPDAALLESLTYWPSPEQNNERK